MTEKCMAKPIHLHLRNKIFYYRVELPRVNNKRRYKIISLHTQNYYEAQEKIKQMEELQEQFIRLQRLYNNLIFVKVQKGIGGGSWGFSVSDDLVETKLSKQNDLEDIKTFYELYLALSQKIDNLSKENQAISRKLHFVNKESIL